MLFDIKTLDVVNPQFTFDDDPEYGSITVSFGTHFVGQTLGMSYNSLSETSPVATLSLASGPPDVTTQWDNDASTKFMLGGIDAGAKFTTPIAILFSHPVGQVGFTLGYLDEVPPSTVIEAYDASGASLGVLGGLLEGYSSLSIVDSGGAISGVSIYIPGDGVDEEGFGINDVVFSTGVIPEPATFLIWSVLGLAGVCDGVVLRAVERLIPCKDDANAQLFQPSQAEQRPRYRLSESPRLSPAAVTFSESLRMNRRLLTSAIFCPVGQLKIAQHFSAGAKGGAKGTFPRASRRDDRHPQDQRCRRIARGGSPSFPARGGHAHLRLLLLTRRATTVSVLGGTFPNVPIATIDRVVAAVVELIEVPVDAVDPIINGSTQVGGMPAELNRGNRG